LFTAIVSWWRRERNSTYAAALAFVAIFGCGSFMYYIGRSHPHVLGALFFIWALAITLLCYGAQKHIALPPSPSRQLAIVPGLLLLTHWSLFTALLWPNTKPIVAQLERLKLDDVQGAQQRAELSAFIRRNVGGSARTILMLPTGHRIAFEQGLRNDFPFPHAGSVILKAQAHEVEKVVVAKNIKSSLFPSSSNARSSSECSRDSGFKKRDSFGDVNLWIRSSPGAGAR
jgi:hypothetical protein